MKMSGSENLKKSCYFMKNIETDKKMLMRIISNEDIIRGQEGTGTS